MMPKINTYNLVFLVLLIVVSVGVSLANAEQEDSKNQLIESIIGNIPDRWSLVERSFDVIPKGHYWGLEYKGPKGWSLTFEGYKDVYLHWKDNNGNWHQEALAKESIELWVMPPDYSESWKRFFVIHRPKAAELLYSGKFAKIYGYPGHRMVSDERFKEILLNATSTKWPESPANKDTLSWGSWKKDIRGILAQ